MPPFEEPSRTSGMGGCSGSDLEGRHGAVRASYGRSGALYGYLGRARARRRHPMLPLGPWLALWHEEAVRAPTASSWPCSVLSGSPTGVRVAVSAGHRTAAGAARLSHVKGSKHAAQDLEVRGLGRQARTVDDRGIEVRLSCALAPEERGGDIDSVRGSGSRPVLEDRPRGGFVLRQRDGGHCHSLATSSRASVPIAVV